MKAIVLSALIFVSAAIVGVTIQYGVTVALWVTVIGIGVIAVMVLSYLTSSAPPTLSGTKRVQIARAIYEGRSTEDNTRHSMPSVPNPHIPLHQRGQHQGLGVTIPTDKEIARLIEQLNR